MNVQVGILLGPLLNTLSNLGYLLPVGTCGDNCLGGLTLCGGFGLFTQGYGLTIDHLLEVTLMDHNANIIKASNYVNNDLFKALKGGGCANFGIVLEYKFNIIYVPCVQIYNIEYEYDKLDQLIYWLDNYSESIPIGISVNISFDGVDNPIIVDGIANQDINISYALESLLKIGYTKYEHEYRNLNSACRWMATGGYGRPPFVVALILFATKNLGSDGANIIKNSLEKGKINNSITGISCLVLGGKFKEVASNETAFPWRNSKYWIEIFARTPYQENISINKDWVHTTSNNLCSIINVICEDKKVCPKYTGFFDYTLTREQAWYAYYGKNVPWLRDVKTTYDPYNFFKSEQTLLPYNTL